MESQVNPQPNDPNLRIALSIHRAMNRAKITARQRSIMDFILSLSWGCGKPSAIIPNLKDFILCGVGSNHIKSELQTLESARAIIWDRKINTFQFNKHFDQWSFDPIKGFDIKRWNELLSENIKIRSPNLIKEFPKKGNELPESGNELPKSGNEIVPEMGNELPIIGNQLPETGNESSKNNANEQDGFEGGFPKREMKTSRNGKYKLPKKGNRMFSLSSRSKGFQLSITSTIAIIIARKKKKEEDKVSVPDPNYESFYSAHIRLFKKPLTQFRSGDFIKYIDEDGMEEKLIIHAFERMNDKANNYSLNYVNTTLIRYLNAGVLTVEAAKLIDADFDNPPKKVEFVRGGNSGKPSNPIVSEEKGKGEPVSPEELEELLKLARKLDGKD